MKYEKKTLYVYEVDGKEKLQVSSDIEAKKWDGIFATASKLYQLMQKHELGFQLSNGDRSELCIFLAKHKQEFYQVLQAAIDQPTTQDNHAKGPNTQPASNGPVSPINGAGSNSDGRKAPAPNKAAATRPATEVNKKDERMEVPGEPAADKGRFSL